jgi:hypothetical protein
LTRERMGSVEAEVGDDGVRARLEWARDSAFRFFPLLHHQGFGLTLRPFDLATNKVLALVGRLARQVGRRVAVPPPRARGSPPRTRVPLSSEARACPGRCAHGSG